MGLSFRHPNNNLSKRWYWDCEILGRRLSLGLCKMKGIPPKEWTEDKDWSLSYKGDKYFEDSRAAAIAMAPAAIAEKKAEILKDPENELRNALRAVNKNHKDPLPLMRNLYDLFVADTQALLDQKVKAGKSTTELVLKRRNLQLFCDWWRKNRRGTMNKSILEVKRADAEEYRSYLREKDKDSLRQRKVVTVEKTRNHLKQIFDRYLPKLSPNPFDLDPMPKEDSEDSHPAVLDERELTLIGEVAKAKDILIYDLAMLSINTSLRKGDCCMLQWSSVLFEEVWTDAAGNTGKGIISLRVRKTGKGGVYPMTNMLKDILERRFSERKKDDIYVFPEAANLYQNNPCGLTYRLQKIFVDALGPERGIFIEDGRVEDLTSLSEVLDEVKAKIFSCPMAATKREKMIKVLELYANGTSMKSIAELLSIPKSSVCLYLNDAQGLILPRRFIKNRNIKRFGYRRAIAELTRSQKTVGMKRDSELNFMSFRTSFVTLLHKKGIKDEVIQKFTAHTSPRMIRTIYDRSMGTDFAGALDVLAPSLTGSAIKMLPTNGDVIDLATSSKVNLPVPAKQRNGVSLARILKKLSPGAKAKIPQLTQEAKSDLLKLTSVEDFEAFLALA